MKWLYYPATVPSRTGRIDSPTPTGWTDPRCRDWGEDYHPAILASYYHWAPIKEYNFHEDVQVFGDSGGYSILTQGAHIDPIDVLRWQIRNCTVGAILDVPPYHKNRALQWGNLNKTLHNVERALPLYLNEYQHTAFRWWGVIQGRTRRELEDWFYQVYNLYPFREAGEGWAIKPVPTNDPQAVARGLGLIRDQGITRVHSLMTTGAKTVTTLLTLGPRAGVDFLSFDSSAADQMGKNRVIYTLSPDHLELDSIEERYQKTGKHPAESYLMNECACHSCQCLRVDYPNMRIPREGSYISQRYLFHNVLTLQRFFRALAHEAEKDPMGLLKDRLGPRERDATLRAFDNQEAQTVERGSPRSVLSFLK